MKLNFLGVGQALDVDGSRKLDLSFLILDRGKIFKTLAQTSLMCGSCHIRSILIGVEYRNWHLTFDDYLLSAILLGKIY